MALTDITEFEDCVKLAKEIKELRDRFQILEQVQPIEEKDKQEVKKMLKTWQDDKIKVLNKLDNLEEEYYDLAHTFCKQNGHTLIEKISYISYIPLYHSSKRGFVYPSEKYCSCSVCNYSEDPEDFVARRKGYYPAYVFYRKSSDEVIQKAAVQNENLKIKKTAQRILEIRELIKNFDELHSISWIDRRRRDRLIFVDV